MKAFRQAKTALFLLLIVAILWIATVVYLNFSKVELKGEFAGFDVDYETTLMDPNMGLGDSVSDLASPLSPSFNKGGLENLVERVEKTLIVPPRVFHNLQNDAVIEKGIEDLDIVY